METVCALSGRVRFGWFHAACHARFDQQEHLQGRVRTLHEPFTFGYIGTHIPAKGVHHLIEAFRHLSGQPRLRIWGRPSGADTDSLRALVAVLPTEVQERIHWMGEYHNAAIIPQVFNACDAIVVPSIWLENAPLVIHEALQARVESFDGALFVIDEQGAIRVQLRAPLPQAHTLHGDLSQK